MIFKLPSQYGSSQHLLAYVEWFRPLRSRDAATGMYKIRRATANRKRQAEIVSVHRLWQGCHLAPKFPSRSSETLLPVSWTSHNVLELAEDFYLNHYINFYLFERMQHT